MSSWCNRVKLNLGKQASWTHCPVIRESGDQIIRDVQIDNRQPWRENLLKSLEINYKKAPNFAATYQLVKELLAYQTDLLADFNIHAIKSIATILLGDNVPSFVRQSTLTAPGKATERLINIAKACGANAYLCGGGAAGYQDDGKFAEQGILLVYQNYVPQQYGKAPGFLPGLSVID